MNWLYFGRNTTESILVTLSLSLSLSLCIYIYIEREREANMLSVVFRPKYNQFIFQFPKSKKLIQTIRCVLHIEMCLETKFYFFLEFFYYLLSHFENRWSNDGLTKQWNCWISDFQSGLINSKKNPKKYKIWSPSTFQYGEHI